tara:strand:+ start:604 stop:1068 length:465 start_codon:yes stop_codon:yes gene_type:complete
VAVESKDVESWIRGQVAKVNKKTRKAICPFAKATLQNKKIKILPAKDNVLAQVRQLCDLFAVLNLDIIIIYFNSKIKETKLSNICKQAHTRTPNLAVMYDHPDNKGTHEGVSFSFKKAPLIFIQSLPKLKEAQKILDKTGYYKAWGIKDYDQFY